MQQQHYSLVLMLKLGKIGSRRLRGKTLKRLTQELSHGSVLVLKATGTSSARALQVHWKVKTAAHNRVFLLVRGCAKFLFIASVSGFFSKLC